MRRIRAWRHPAVVLPFLILSALARAAEAPVTDPGSPRLRFGRVSADDGLSSNFVWAIAQDATGFLWFGTYDGLNRYDGSAVVVYRHDPSDPTTLSNSFIQQLFVDRAGTLWAGTTNGLNSYDARTDRFTRFEHDPARAGSLSGDSVYAIYEDRAGALWIGTNAGLDRYDRERGSFTAYRHDPADPASLSHDQVLAIVEDHAGVLWVGTNGGGIARLDRASGRFTAYRHEPADPASLSSDDVMSLALDSSGGLWIGTWGGGLNHFDPLTGHFTVRRHDPADPRSLQDDRVPSVLTDSKGATWVGTFSGGLNILEPTRRGFSAYKDGPGDIEALQSNRVMQIFEDRSRLIWIATEGGGVHRYDPRQQAFRQYRHVPGDPRSLAGDTVWAIHEDPGGFVWLGTHGQGLDRLDRATGEITHFRSDPGNPRTLGFPTVTDIQGDRAGILWIGTYGGGLYRFDPATSVFTSYRHDATDPHSLSHDTVTRIAEDGEGRLWIATSRGLDRFDRATGRVMAFFNDAANPESLISDDLLALVVDRRGRVWCGGFGGVNRLDPASGRVTRYRHDPADPGSLSSDDVHVLREDHSGNIWVGTFDGIANRLDPETGRVTRFPGSGAPVGGHVSSILEEASDGSTSPGIWVVQSRRLSRIDTTDGSVQAYGPNHGLPAAPLARTAIVGRSGEFLLSSTRGLVIVDPRHLQPDLTPVPVVLTGLLLANRPVPIGAASVLKQSLDSTGSLTLSHRDRVVSFQFAALDFRAPREVRYRYKLEGFDSDWSEVDATRRLATYTNLDAGRYVFRVTAANADGAWNEDGRALALVVTPPWWGTAWFRVVAASAALAGLLAAHLFQTRALERRQRALEAELSERREMERALRQAHAKVQELAGRLITAQEEERRRIARELHDDVNQRVAALSIALSGLGGRLPKGTAGLRLELARLEESAQNLSEAVRGLSHGLHPAVLEHAGLVAALRGCCRELGSPAELTLAFPDDIEPVPPDTALCVYRGAQEALHNAARHAGARHIRVALEVANGELELRVSDDGCGFDVAEGRRHGGLGLVSLEERARLVGGRVTVTSQARHGTEIRLVVPLLRD